MHTYSVAQTHLHCFRLAEQDDAGLAAPQQLRRRLQDARVQGLRQNDALRLRRRHDSSRSGADIVGSVSLQHGQP